MNVQTLISEMQLDYTPFLFLIFSLMRCWLSCLCLELRGKCSGKGIQLYSLFVFFFSQIELDEHDDSCCPSADQASGRLLQETKETYQHWSWQYTQGNLARTSDGVTPPTYDCGFYFRKDHIEIIWVRIAYCHDSYPITNYFVQLGILVIEKLCYIVSTNIVGSLRAIA